MADVKIYLQKNGAWLGLFTLVILLVILTKGDFVSARNLTNLIRQASINGILACGMTLVIITSGIDLSVGSLVALAGITVGISQLDWQLAQSGTMGAWISLSIGTLVGLAAGATSGLLIALLGIAPFVITLGVMVIARGLALIFSNGSAISPMSEEFGLFTSSYVSPMTSVIVIAFVLGMLVWSSRKEFKNIFFPSVLLIALGISFFNYKGLPVIAVFLAVCALFTHFLMSKTIFGRSVFAVGSNVKAAFWAGVNVKKTVFYVYALMGALAGLAGVLLTSRLNGADPNAGQLFELDAIAAVVIGGTSLKGGSGSIVGSLVGALTIATLNNGMDLMGVPSFYQMVFKGLIIIAAVAIDSSQRKALV